MPLFFYQCPKSENLECDSITYINGKDSDLRNGFIKSYPPGIVDLKMDFPHSNDALAITNNKTYFCLVDLFFLLQL